MDPWQTLTSDYEQSRAREDSLDQLMEWDAQRSLIGSVGGKTVLDIGCGNGEKAIELVRDHGATATVGVLEPQLSEEKKQQYPHKQAWLSQYVGIIIFRARPV
ncbi:hypothetical protein [Kribbella sp. C-35]|uniref:hypothetical protein n=1 Tax=Kribbella sp. C-35 TaxID=2789276 RepID=UPI00397B750D